MGIAEIRGEKTGGGVGVQDHLGQTNYAEICILVTKYISKLNKIQITRTHTQPFNGPWSGTTLVGRYQKKHPSWSSDILYHLPPFTTQRPMTSSLFILRAWQSSYNLSPGPLWSSTWSWTLNFILHTFLQPIIIFFSQHMPIPTQAVLLQYQCSVIYT